MRNLASKFGRLSAQFLGLLTQCRNLVPSIVSMQVEDLLRILGAGKLLRKRE